MGGSNSKAIGLTYSTNDSTTNQNLQAIQTLFSVSQKNFCAKNSTNFINYLRSKEAIELFNGITKGAVSNTDVLQLLTSTDATTYEIGGKKMPSLSSQIKKMTQDPNERVAYMNTITSAVSIILQNSSNKSGKLDGNVIRNELINVLIAFCGPPKTDSKSSFGMSNTVKYSSAGLVIVIILAVVGFIVYKKKGKKPVAAAFGFGKRRRR